MTPAEQFERNLRAAREVRENLAFVLFLLLGHALLFLAWGLYRHWRGGPRQQNVPLAFVALLFVGMVTMPWVWKQLVAAWQALPPFTQADAIVAVHLGFMLTVVAAQALVLAGWVLRWAWVRNFWFRFVHLLCIHLVASQAALELDCPLTTWEWELRGADWVPLEGASAIGRVSHRLLIHEAGAIYFVIYAAFALVVLLTWLFVPPRWPWASGEEPSLQSSP